MARPGGVTIPAVVVGGVTVVPAVVVGRPPGGGGGPAGSSGTGGPNGHNGTALFTTAPRKVARTIAQFGTSRCIGGTFKAIVTGLNIRKVVFSQDGRVIATRTKAPWQALVGTGEGVHWVVARVTFTRRHAGRDAKAAFQDVRRRRRQRQRAGARGRSSPRTTPAFTG